MQAHTTINYRIDDANTVRKNCRTIIASAPDDRTVCPRDVDGIVHELRQVQQHIRGPHLKTAAGTVRAQVTTETTHSGPLIQCGDPCVCEFCPHVELGLVPVK